MILAKATTDYLKGSFSEGGAFLWNNLREELEQQIALFTDNLQLHLDYSEIKRECEAISSKNGKIAQNCLVYTLNCIVMQTSKVICEKGYSLGLSKIGINEFFSVWGV